MTTIDRSRKATPLRGRVTSLTALAGAAFVLLAATDAAAVPAFARKYRISCTTCHAPFPRLKAYGDEFAGRGFRMEEDQEPARATHDVGDPELLLSREFPLAARLEGYASWKEDSEAENDLEAPWVWKILSGGPVSRAVSYYFYFLIEQGEVVGLEDAYLQFNDVGGSGADLVLGQFQVCDPLFKRELRLERFDYLIYKTQVGDSPVDLTYDRGIMLMRSLPGDIDAVAMVLNGNGIHEAESEGVSDYKKFDNDDLKNVALRLARQVGPVRVGGFGYWGKSREMTGDVENRTWYAGPDLVVDFSGRAELNAQFLYREDDDPFFTGADDTRETKGGFAELHFFPQGQDGLWVLTGLYNRVDSDDDAADRETASLTVSRLLARNVRLMVEGGRDLEAEKARVTAGVVTAF
ncbi:MAG TPA: hypothetical protein VKU85_18415 [bacterium]|nr:hypothetical protein [bacterium]